MYRRKQKNRSRPEKMRSGFSPEDTAKLLELRARLQSESENTLKRRQETAASYVKQRDKRPSTLYGNHKIPLGIGKKSRTKYKLPKLKKHQDGQERPKDTVTVVRTVLYEDPTYTPYTSKHKSGSTTVASPKQQFTWWELPLEAAIREPPPSNISQKDKVDFERILDLGGVEDETMQPELFGVIGLDFGTSSTKVIVRFPYEAGQPTVAVPAPPHCRSERDGYLWQTVLWLRKNGEFIAWPETNAYTLHALKQGIMGKDPLSPIIDHTFGDLKVQRTDAATAYLAFVIRYVRGWLRANRAQLFRGRQARWLLNLGLPAEAADSGPLSSTYRQIAAAALLCADSAKGIDIEVTNIFSKKDAVRAARNSGEEALNLGIGIFPETVAEAAGFAKSSLAAPDLYLMIDIGATTLDVCTFRLHRAGTGEDQYALQNGMVRPLGVEAMYWFLSQGKTKAGFQEQCDRCIREVVWSTKVKKDPNAHCWNAGNQLPVFLVGGGARNALHGRIVDALTPWLQQYAGNQGIRIVEVPPPRDIDCPLPLADFRRMGVAWGLSYPDDEIGTVLPLSVSDDIAPLPASAWSDRFVSKDQV